MCAREGRQHESEGKTPKLWLAENKAHRAKKLTNPRESTSYPHTHIQTHIIHASHTQSSSREDISRSMEAQVTGWTYHTVAHAYSYLSTWVDRQGGQKLKGTLSHMLGLRL